MKLYGTITSERASKRQGGNRYLVIEVLNQEQTAILELLVSMIDDENAEVQFTDLEFSREPVYSTTLKVNAKRP